MIDPRTPWDDPAFDDARAIQREAGLLDLHVDSIIQERLFGYDPRRPHRALLRGQPLFWHADLPRMREAAYGAACLGIHYWPWESRGATREMLRQIDVLDRLCAQDPLTLRVYTPEAWTSPQAAGRLALAPGVEGAHMLGGELDQVRTLAERGAAYLTLCHFTVNSAATPSMGRGHNERDGLTSWGRQLVRSLNQWGIAVDLAHVNTPGVLDACAVAQAPLFCTHTGVKGVHDHARNISDAEIDAIAQTGGAIGVMFAPGFLTGRLFADSRAAADHLDYIVQRVGIEHVAIGSDYDGWLPTILSDHRDCRDIVRLTAVLLERGYTRDDLLKLLKHNATRVLLGAWEARNKALRDEVEQARSGARAA